MIVFYGCAGVHVTLELLLNDMELLSEVNELVESSGRSTPVSVSFKKNLHLGNGHNHSSTNGFGFLNNGNGHLEHKLSSSSFEENANGQISQC